MVESWKNRIWVYNYSLYYIDYDDNKNKFGGWKE